MSKEITTKNEELQIMSVQEVMNTFNPLFKHVSSDLINKTGLYSSDVESLYNRRLEPMMEDLKNKGLLTVELAVENNQEHLMKRCIKEIADKHKDEYSPFEIKEVQNVLSRVSDQYDLSDARIYILIKTLINHLLSSVRFQIESMAHDSLIEQVSAKGASYIVINPAEKVKLDYDRAIVDLIDRLSKMIHGTKTSVNVDGTVTLEPGTGFYDTLLDSYKQRLKVVEGEFEVLDEE